MQTARSSGFRSRALAAIAALLATQISIVVEARETAENVGDVLRVALPATAYALTWKRDDREGRRQFYKSFGTSVVTTWVLKETVDKERPDGSDTDAFPSGHASAAFQGAAFIHRRYGGRGAWLAYALAAVTAWSRVDADEHDTADVLGGAAVGIASSFVLTKRRNVEVSASLTSDTFGLSVSGRLR